MKVVVETNEEEGLLALIGKKVTLFCGVYIYAGTLIGVNEKCVKLKDAFIVYETGELTTGTFKDAQKLPKNWYVVTNNIESFGELK